MKIRGLIISLTALAALTACLDEEPAADDSRRMPIYLSLPASDSWATRAAETGDPGYRQEVFRFPKYAYIYLVTYANATDAANKQNGHVHPVVVPNATAPNLDGEWVRTLWQAATQTEADSIYRYMGQLSVALDNDVDIVTGRVYVVTSPVYIEPKSTPTTEQGIIDLLYDFPAETGYTAAYKQYDYLKDIYSTPYNYNIGGQYYGTIATSGQVWRADLLLYHVAAKVDVIWNVAEEKQPVTRVSAMRFNTLKHNDCYVFKPNANTTAGSDTYQLDVPDITPGNQWYGRYAFYTIPYTAATPYSVDMSIWTNGHAATAPADISHTIQATWDANAIFTPWIRADIVVNK